MIDITNKNSVTVYAAMNLTGPYAMITPPYLKGIGKKPKPIVFWTKEDCEDFLLKLPKDWLINLLLK